MNMPIPPFLQPVVLPVRFIHISSEVIGITVAKLIT